MCMKVYENALAMLSADLNEGQFKLSVNINGKAHALLKYDTSIDEEFGWCDVTFYRINNGKLEKKHLPLLEEYILLRLPNWREACEERERNFLEYEREQSDLFFESYKW